MKKIFYTLAFLFMFVSFTYALPPVYFTGDVNYAGSGCPSDTIVPILSADASTLTIIFTEYEAMIDEETSPVVSRFCNMNVPIHIPQGWQYSLVDITHRGGVTLDPGVQATFTERYYFAGQRGLKKTRRMSGLKDEDYTFTDKFGIASYSWSPCGRNVGLNLRSKIKLDNRRNRNGFGLVDRESTDIDIKRTYRFSWRRCIR